MGMKKNGLLTVDFFAMEIDRILQDDESHIFKWFPLELQHLPKDLLFLYRILLHLMQKTWNFRQKTLAIETKKFDHRKTQANLKNFFPKIDRGKEGNDCLSGSNSIELIHFVRKCFNSILGIVR